MLIVQILVTGAEGFIGGRLCAYLTQHGHRVRRGVRATENSFDTVTVSDATPVERLVEVMAGMDCVIHLAAAVHDVHSGDDERDEGYQEVNVVFTRQLAEAACAAGVRRFVFASSIKVCGENSGDRGRQEDDAGHPVGAYAKSKWFAEEELRRIEGEAGLEVVIVRPPLVYGPGVKANFQTLLAAVYAGVPLPLSWLKNKRSLIYLENLVSAMAVCATHPQAAGKSFHVSDQGSVTLPELVTQLSRAMGKRSRLFPCPQWLLKLAAIAVGRRPQIERLINDLEVDSRRIHGLLGWSPGYSFEQGIQETVNWYLAGRNLSSQSIAFPAERSGRLSVCQLCAVDFTLQHLLLPLIDGMQERGWRVTSACAEGGYVQGMRRRGYRLRTVSISRNLFSVPAHLKAIWNIYKLCRNERFDVLHVHTPIAALVGRIAGKIARVPLVIYTAHGFYFHEEMPRWRYRFFVLLERWAGRLTDHLFTQSSEDAQTAIAEHIASASAVTAIGNGVNIDLFVPDGISRAQTRSSLGLPPEAFVIGVIARLVREKGLGEFLEAATELGIRFPHVHFLLVGERLPSDHNASVETELSAAKSVLGDRLLATGYRADVAALLGAMDVFCLPSYREGMPRSIIEAMMMALPVVATDIRGAREEVVTGETGLLVPTRDTAALIRALEVLIQDPEQGRRMGLAGRQRALELYDERRVVARQIEIINTLIASKSNRSSVRAVLTADASD